MHIFQMHCDYDFPNDYYVNVLSTACNNFVPCKIVTIRLKTLVDCFDIATHLQNWKEPNKRNVTSIVINIPICTYIIRSN